MSHAVCFFITAYVWLIYEQETLVTYKPQSYKIDNVKVKMAVPQTVPAHAVICLKVQ